MNPFKLARMEKGLNQNELAVILNCSRSHVAMIESNKTIPNGIVMLKLCYIFKLEPLNIIIYYNKKGLSKSLT